MKYQNLGFTILRKSLSENINEIRQKVNTANSIIEKTNVASDELKKAREDKFFFEEELKKWVKVRTELIDSEKKNEDILFKERLKQLFNKINDAKLKSLVVAPDSFEKKNSQIFIETLYENIMKENKLSVDKIISKERVTRTVKKRNGGTVEKQVTKYVLKPNVTEKKKGGNTRRTRF